MTEIESVAADLILFTRTNTFPKIGDEKFNDFLCLLDKLNSLLVKAKYIPSTLREN